MLWLSLRQHHWYSGKQSRTVGHDICIAGWESLVGAVPPADPLELGHYSEGLHLPKAPAGV